MRVSNALYTARDIEEVRWSEDGAKGWSEIYADLSAPKPGLLGALVNDLLAAFLDGVGKTGGRK